MVVKCLKIHIERIWDFRIHFSVTPRVLLPCFWLFQLGQGVKGRFTWVTIPLTGGCHLFYLDQSSTLCRHKYITYYSSRCLFISSYRKTGIERYPGPMSGVVSLLLNVLLVVGHRNSSGSSFECVVLCGTQSDTHNEISLWTPPYYEVLSFNKPSDKNRHTLRTTDVGEEQSWGIRKSVSPFSSPSSL